MVKLCIGVPHGRDRRGKIASRMLLLLCSGCPALKKELAVSSLLERPDEGLLHCLISILKSLVISLPLLRETSALPLSFVKL